MAQDSEKEHLPAFHKLAISSQPLATPKDDGLLNGSYRKVDCRLLTWYAFVFLLMKMESHNIANAAIMNIEVSTIEGNVLLGPNPEGRLTLIHRWNSKARISSTSSAT